MALNTGAARFGLLLFPALLLITDAPPSAYAQDDGYLTPHQAMTIIFGHTWKSQLEGNDLIVSVDGDGTAIMRATGPKSTHIDHGRYFVEGKYLCSTWIDTRKGAKNCYLFKYVRGKLIVHTTDGAVVGASERID